MTSSLSTLERDALDEVERRLIGKGYSVVREPRGDAVPNFLGQFQPDAIAIGKQPQLVIEIIARRGSASVDAAKVEQIRQLISDHHDWALEVVYTTPSSSSPGVGAPHAIRARFGEIQRLAKIDGRAALIMAWSMLEAVARALLPDRAERALTPASTVELLASLGYVDKSEADMLRDAGRARNLMVHGDLNQQISPADLNSVLDIIDGLIGVLERQSGGLG